MEGCASHSSYDNCSKKRNATRPFGYKGRRSQESSLGRSSKEGEFGPSGADGLESVAHDLDRDGVRLCRRTNGQGGA